jgi:hypothetical protein
VRIDDALDCGGGNCSVNGVTSCPEYIDTCKGRGRMRCRNHPSVVDGNRASRHHEISLSLHLFYRFLFGDLRDLQDPMNVVPDLSSRSAPIRRLLIML